MISEQLENSMENLYPGVDAKELLKKVRKKKTIKGCIFLIKLQFVYEEQYISQTLKFVKL